MSITGDKTHVMLHRYSHAIDEHKRNAVVALPVPESNRTPNVLTIRKFPRGLNGTSI